MHKPSFVYLLEGDLKGVISCTPHSYLASNRIFLISQVTAHLESIWLANHPKIRSYALPGSIQRTRFYRQTHKLSIHALTLDPTLRNPKVRPKKFDGSFPMAEEDKNKPQEKSEILFLLSELIQKRPHKILPHKCEKRELKIKSDLKPYFEDDHLENLRVNSFRQGEDDAPMEGHYECQRST